MIVNYNISSNWTEKILFWPEKSFIYVYNGGDCTKPSITLKQGMESVAVSPKLHQRGSTFHPIPDLAVNSNVRSELSLTNISFLTLSDNGFYCSQILSNVSFNSSIEYFDIFLKQFHVKMIWKN